MIHIRAKLKNNVYAGLNKDEYYVLEISGIEKTKVFVSGIYLEYKSIYSFLNNWDDLQELDGKQSSEVIDKSEVVRVIQALKLANDALINLLITKDVISESANLLAIHGLNNQLIAKFTRLETLKPEGNNYIIK